MSNPTYRVVPMDPSGHRLQVTLQLPEIDEEGQLLSLPTWIPGSYLIREFARNWVSITARDDDGALALERIDKSTWRVPAGTRGPVTVEGIVYCWDLSVRSAHLDRTHGYFNGTSVFLRPHGRDDGPLDVELCAPDDPACADWRVATTLPRVEGAPLGFGRFRASDYDELIDHPVEMGTFRHLTFTASGIPHEVALTGRLPDDLDEARLLEDCRLICEAQHQMMGTVPLERYLFQVMVVGNGYGGLEHRSSTSLVCKRSDLPTTAMGKSPSEGYRNLLGLISHEYFHLYNVKRIKPAAFTPYDLSRENPTTLLWAFEGITSYVDDLTLVRSGRITESQYLEQLGQNFTRVLRTPGRLRQSLADASYDAWTKFYRQDENSPNALISYYAKGALVALALDLELRRRGDYTLDHLMRDLYARHGETGVGVEELGIETLVAEQSGLDLTAFFDQAIRGTADLDWASLLEDFGVQLHLRPRQGSADKGGKKGKSEPPQAWWGASVRAGKEAKLASVLWDSPAHQAGLSAGDVIVAVDRLQVSGKDLDGRLSALQPGTEVEVHAFRRDELFETRLTVAAPPEDTVWLELEAEPDPVRTARRSQWWSVPRFT